MAGNLLLDLVLDSLNGEILEWSQCDKVNEVTVLMKDVNAHINQVPWEVALGARFRLLGCKGHFLYGNGDWVTIRWEKVK